MKQNDWFSQELAFITFLYKYKSFFGSLKRKDFNDYPTREEAWEQFEKENEGDTN